MIGRKVGKLVVTEYDPATRSCTCTCTCGSGKVFVFSKDVLLRSKNPHCGCEDKVLLDEATLYRLYHNHRMTIQEIAKETGHNRNTVAKYLRLYGFEKRVPRREDLVQLYLKEKLPVREVASLLGFTDRVIYLWLKKYEIHPVPAKTKVESSGRPGPKQRVLLGRMSGELRPVEYVDDNNIRCLCSCGRSIVVPRAKLYKQRVRDCGCGISYESERTWVQELLDQNGVEYIKCYKTLHSRHPHDFALFSDGRVRFFLDIIERPHGCRCTAEAPILHIPRTTKEYVQSMVIPVIEYVKSAPIKREQ